MMSSTITLEDGLNRGRHNNMDILRLVAAMAVVVSHAWPLALGPGTPEPLEALIGLSLGKVAVFVFFFLSGMLVSASADRNMGSRVTFLKARVFRIFPGLAVALVVTAGLAQGFGANAGLSELATYVLRGLSLVSLQHTIGMAFADAPYPLAVNGPLWTLFYEVLCYAIVASAIWSGLLGKVWGWGLLVAVAGGLWMAFDVLDTATAHPISYRLSVLAPLLLTFVMGAVFWRLRRRIVLHWGIGVLLMVPAILLVGHAMFLPAFVLALGYGLCLVSFRLPTVALKGDISYGIYIYGWPVSQCLVALLAPMSPLALAVLSLGAVLPFACLSWVLIEKPSLALLRKPAIIQKARTAVSG